MTDVHLNIASLATTSATTAPAAGASETWTVAALSSKFRLLQTGETYALVDATAGATSAQQDEIVRVTACTGSGATSITVTRGCDGTTPVAHANPSTFNVVLVKEAIPAVKPPLYAAKPDVTPKNLFSALQGIYNYDSSITRRADQGLTNASRGVGSTGPVVSAQVGYTKELVIGDSVTAGCTGGMTGNITFARGDAWPYAMRDTLALWGIPANGTGIYRCQDGVITNTQYWTLTGTWVGATNFTYISSTVVGATATLTVDRPGQIVDVLYADGFTGTFTISVNGATSGAGFATVTGAGVNRTGKKRLSVPTYPGSTIKITYTVAGTGMGLIGASVWTPNGGLIIDNIAQGGSKAGGANDRTDWTETTNVGAPWNVFGGVYKGGVGGQRLTSTTVTTTTGSPNVSTSTAIFDADAHTGVPMDFVPDATKGAAFPAGTYIVSVTDSTHAVLSQNALTTNAANQTAYVDRDPSVVHIAIGGNDLQNGRTGAQIAASITTLVGRIQAQWPIADIILHLENELAPSLASSAQELDMQRSMYALADTLNLPLYDWRDRAGAFATAMANGIYNDPVAHMTPAMYTNLGAALAFARCVAGSGPAQSPRGPVLDNDNVPKWYMDGYGRFQSPIVAAGTAFTATEQIIYQIPVPPNIFKIKDQLEIDAYGGYTATVVGALIGKIRIGTAGTIAGDTAQVITSGTSPNAGATGSGWHIKGTLTVRTVGSSGTIEGAVTVELDTGRKLMVPVSLTVDTTVQNYITLCGIASGGTTPSFTPQMAYHLTQRKT